MLEGGDTQVGSSRAPISQIVGSIHDFTLKKSSCTGLIYHGTGFFE